MVYAPEQPLEGDRITRQAPRWATPDEDTTLCSGSLAL
jgi:hypothetical protein